VTEIVRNREHGDGAPTIGRTGIRGWNVASADEHVWMPVVDDGELAGIITLDDLTVLLTGELRNLAGVIEAESPPY